MCGQFGRLLRCCWSFGLASVPGFSFCSSASWLRFAYFECFAYFEIVVE